MFSLNRPLLRRTKMGQQWDDNDYGFNVGVWNFILSYFSPDIVAKGHQG